MLQYVFYYLCRDGDEFPSVVNRQAGRQVKSAPKCFHHKCEKNVRLHYSVFDLILKTSVSLKTNSVLPFYSAMMPIFPEMSDPQIYSLSQVDFNESFHASLRNPQDFCVLCIFFLFSCKCYLSAWDHSNSPIICESGGPQPLKHTQV